MAEKTNYRKQNEKVHAKKIDLDENDKDFTVKMLEWLDESDATSIDRERRKIKTASQISKALICLLVIILVSIIVCLILDMCGIKTPSEVFPLFNTTTWVFVVFNTIACCEQAVSRSRISMIEAQRDYRHLLVENIKLKADNIELLKKHQQKNQCVF